MALIILKCYVLNLSYQPKLVHLTHLRTLIKRGQFQYASMFWHGRRKVSKKEKGREEEGFDKEKRKKIGDRI